jgi:hypothetical protein
MINITGITDAPKMTRPYPRGGYQSIKAKTTAQLERERYVREQQNKSIRPNSDTRSDRKTEFTGSSVQAGADISIPATANRSPFGLAYKSRKGSRRKAIRRKSVEQFISFCALAIGVTGIALGFYAIIGG